MTSAERSVLATVRATTTDDLVRAYRKRKEGSTIEEAMRDRWLAMAILGELLRRNAIWRLK